MRYLLLFTMLLTFQLTSQASHVLGGEITWTCLANGNFVFKMHIYTDPNGISHNFTNKTLQVDGSSLPTNSSSNPITTITVKPNLTATALTFNGYYVYESDPINLNGVPPASGWTFSYDAGCCRGVATNFNGANNTLFKAIMYPNAINTPVNTCFDSSPQFMEMPKVTFYNNIDYISQNIAVDFNGDSLVHRLDQPFSGTGSATTNLPFRNGYGLNNYTGNGNLNGNTPYSVEQNTGNVAFSFISNNGVSSFNRVITVDSYREGVKVSTVSREMVIRVFQPFGNFVLNQPQINPNQSFDSFGIKYDTVMAGNLISIPIRIIDTVNTGDTMTLVPFGSTFSADLFNSANCNDPSDTSCATLFPTPIPNTSTYPSRAELQGIDSLTTTLYWTPTCYHIGSNGTSKTHYFTFGYEVNNFSEPTFYRTFAITVNPNPAICNIVTSLETQEGELEDISLFPNPTDGRFKLVSSNDISTVEIFIRNSKGQLIESLRSSNYPSQELEILGPAGVYFVELLDENRSRKTLKVIKR